MPRIRVNYMKVLVTGAAGQVGSEVTALLIEKKIEYIALDHTDLDITNKNAVRAVFKGQNFTHVIHCAAYTDVNKAEKEKMKCLTTNTDGTHNIAEVCREEDIVMIYVSTDYVFDGKKDRPYRESDKCRPLNYYGLTKLLGDGEVLRVPKKFIVRSSWIFGEGNNFVQTMLKLADNGKPIRVIDDQMGSPTYAKHLAVILVEMLFSDRYGIFNVTNDGYCTWYEFAKKIFELAGKNVEVIPIATDEYPSLAKRPLNSRLSKEKMLECGFTPLPEWESALKEYLEHIN